MVFRRVFDATVSLCLFSALASSQAAGAETASMPLGARTKQPIGHYRLCQDRPSECEPMRGSVAGPLVLNPALIERIAEINTETNSEITPASDQELYGREENWTYPAEGRGDCEDYALLKRQRLAAAGIPLANLLLTVVRKKDDTGHAVLTLRTTSGDFVLDNLDWRVKLWTDVPYRFVKRQASDNPGRWVAVGNGGDMPVAALSR